jgi:F-type H+-transporting ATPase subunit delta
MTLTVADYAKALHEALEDTKPEQHEKVIENLVAILKNNNALDQYEAIVAAYEQYSLEQHHRTATVTTAQPLADNAKILDELNTAIGKDAVIKQKVDESLIGGVIINLGDSQIDASVKHQLDSLAETLTNQPLV